LSIVVDNSMALAWTLEDEHSAASDAILEVVTSQGGHVPFIFRAEFANGLTMAVRRKRVDDQGRSEALAFMEGLNLTHDLEGSMRISSAVALADKHDLTVYDALYLELAQRVGCPLATFDKKLSNAARSAAVALAVPAR
jgi:predicted nucleic acid-binding protein